MSNGAQINEPKSKKSLDNGALNGLRGIASFHIVLFHCLHNSPWQINIMAQVRH
jgi:peptidoglycan/LPS O-acetylase OafA/YrhL